MKKWKAPSGIEFSLSDTVNVGKFDMVRNLQARASALGGKTPLELFGEDVPLDQISVTNWQPDTCGCEVQYIARLDKQEAEVVGGKSMRKCQAHATHPDVHAHLQELHAENRHKNKTINDLAEKHGVHQSEIAFRFDENRQLVVSHPVIGEKQVPRPKVN